MNAPPTASTAVDLDVLTDEELEVLQAQDPLVVRPHLAALPEPERAPTLRTAYRGLVARGILDPRTGGGPDAATEPPTTTMQVRDDVHAIVTLRRGASAVVCVARTTATDQDFWYAHVAEDVVLVERVSTDGLHRFGLAPAAVLGDLLLDASTHPETADGTGPTTTITDHTDPPDEVLQRLGSAVLRADVVVRVPGDRRPVLTGLFTGPGGAWQLTTRLDDGEPTTVSRTTREALTALVRGLAAEALAARDIDGDDL